MSIDMFRQAELSRQHEAEGDDPEELDWKDNPLEPTEDYWRIDDDLVSYDDLVEYLESRGARRWEP